MSKLPSMPFFPADFFADTAHVSGEAAAVYLVLLGHAWLRGGALPNDGRVLARLARISWQKWSVIKAEVMPFWELGPDGLLSQKRLLQNYHAVLSKTASFSENGIKGNEKRWGQKPFDFNGHDIAKAIAGREIGDRNYNQNYKYKSFFNNGVSRQEGRWVPTKRIGSRLFKAGERAPAYDGQPTANWKVLKPEDCQ